MMRFAIACLMLSVLVLAGCGPSQNELRDIGIAKFQVGQNDQAESYFTRILNDKPYDAVSNYYMGRIHHSRGQLEMAQWRYQAAIDADPSLTEARQWCAKVEQELGQTGKILRILPHQPQPFEQQGRAAAPPK